LRNKSFTEHAGGRKIDLLDLNISPTCLAMSSWRLYRLFSYQFA
jgi:hypothetical protein